MCLTVPDDFPEFQSGFERGEGRAPRSGAVHRRVAEGAGPGSHCAQTILEIAPMAAALARLLMGRSDQSAKSSKSLPRCK
jgi:hypothetical protein